MTVETLAHDVAGDGPGIVLVHGLTFSRRTWDPVVDRLAGRFRCLAVDLPGHGDSSGSGADPLHVVERIKATADAAGVRRPLVIGHSAGALTATGYAATYDVAGVVNVDQTLRIAPFAGLLARLAPALRGPEFHAAFEPFRASIGVELLPSPERERVLATQRIEQQTVLDHWSKPMNEPVEDLEAEVIALLEAITVPYLWLSAGEPAAEDREVLEKHLASVQVESWPGTGHMLHLGDPDRFAALVERFAADVA